MSEPDNVVRGNFEPRCNLCKLGEQSPELLEIIHQMRWGEQKPFRTIVDEVNSIITRDSLDVKPLHLSGLVKHMTDHISPEQALVYELQEAASKKKRRLPTDPDARFRAVVLKRESLAKIEENAGKWQEIFEALHREFKLLPEDTNPLIRKMVVESMNKAHTTWAELIKAKETLLKERTLTGEMVQEAVDLYARSVAGAMAEQLTTILDEVKAEEPESGDALDKLFEGFKQAVLNSVTGLYEEAIRATADKYNL